MRWWHKLRQKIPRRQKPLYDKTRVWYDYLLTETAEKHFRQLDWGVNDRAQGFIWMIKGED